MKRLAGVLATGCLLLTACGGGSDDVSSSKTLKVSVYGNPLTSGQAAVSHVQIAHAASDSDASAPVSASDAQATVQSLQDALVARGVPATVTAQVMDGTTLHQIIIGENNGLPPTNDQFKLEPSEWLIVNFQLDDMNTPMTDPNQIASAKQFATDLNVFVDRAAVAGKRVFLVMPFQTCDIKYSETPSDALLTAISSTRLGYPTGGVAGTGAGWDAVNNKVTANPDYVAHMGADCRTPDAYLLNKRVQAIADDLASRYQASLAGQ